MSFAFDQGLVLEAGQRAGHLSSPFSFLSKKEGCFPLPSSTGLPPTTSIPPPFADFHWLPSCHANKVPMVTKQSCYIPIGGDCLPKEKGRPLCLQDKNKGLSPGSVRGQILLLSDVSRLDLGPIPIAFSPILSSLNLEREVPGTISNPLFGLVWRMNRHGIVKIKLVCKYTNTSGLFVELGK